MNLTSAPSFDRARRVSAVVSFLSLLGMAALALGAIAGAVALLFFFEFLSGHIVTALGEVLKSGEIPDAVAPAVQVATAKLKDLPFASRAIIAAVLVAVIAPSFYILFQLRALFTNFAGGQVFTDANIARLRMIGLGLVVSVVVTGLGQFAVFSALGVPDPEFDFKFGPLFYGAIAYVAAYVMGEGRRISDDNAGIV